MATPFYQRMAATATRLLVRYGSPLTMERTTEGEYDPATGSAEATVIYYDIIGAKFDYRADEIDGSRIQSGDARLYSAPNGEKPIPGDTVLIGAETWNVVNSEAIIPATTVVLFDTQIRK